MQESKPEEKSVHEQIRELIEKGEPLPEALVHRQPGEQAAAQGTNRPESTPGLSMEGGVSPHSE